MSIKYKGLAWVVGTTNLPGIREDVYAIAKRDIVNWPTLPESYVTDMGELVTYVGDFTLAALAKFQKIGIIVDKSPVDGRARAFAPAKRF